MLTPSCSSLDLLRDAADDLKGDDGIGLGNVRGRPCQWRRPRRLHPTWTDGLVVVLLFTAFFFFLHAHKVAVLDDVTYAPGAPSGPVRQAVATLARLLIWTGLSSRVLPLSPLRDEPEVLYPGVRAWPWSGRRPTGGSVAAQPLNTTRDADMMRSIRPLVTSAGPFGRLPSNSSVAAAYVTLARAYTKPFREMGGIPRSLYMDVMDREGPGACPTCFLVQVKDGHIYVYDPRGVRSRMSTFHALRMREVLLWTKLALLRGLVGDTEFVASVTDTVATTRCDHPYRLAVPEPEPRPIFSIVHCNVSDNIPFPMFTGDLLRRAFPEFWSSSGGRVARWDAKMAAHATSAADVPWVAKQPRAVFRGVVRVSAHAPSVSDFHATCGSLGRPALLARTRRRRHLFDVQIDGKCGRRRYTARRLTAHQQSAYRYGVYVEGNGFWADRLVLQLFSASATLYQLTPCGLFFEPLLRPYVHVIPVDYHFLDVERQVVWARHHDEEARRVAVQARAFAAEYLSTAAIRSYAEAILVEYTQLLKDRDIAIFPGAKLYS